MAVSLRTPLFGLMLKLKSTFVRAQEALLTHKAITLPRQSDQLWIVTDGALRKLGLGATLYIERTCRPLLSGFFSTKLRTNQRLWLPCEVEVLSIATAIKHYSPFIIQSRLPTCILPNSKPCVQVYENLCRGEFSASPRVSTFLVTASRFQVSIIDMCLVKLSYRLTLRVVMLHTVTTHLVK